MKRGGRIHWSLRTGVAMRGTEVANGCWLVLLVLMTLWAPAAAHFGSCEDHTPACRRMARRGYCQTRRQFMLQNCPVSCNACVDPNCFDRSNRCPMLARRGACQTQRAFMHAQCPHSCDACVIGVSNAVALTNVQTIINPSFECGRPYANSRKKRQGIFPDELDKYFPSRSSPSNRNQEMPILLDQAAQAAQNKDTSNMLMMLPGKVGAMVPTSDIQVGDTFCGATPITDRYLLTAAHCVFDPDRPVTMVRLGELDFASNNEANSRPVDYTVAQIIVHPDFNPASLERYNDVAVIQTVEQIQFNELVYPYCISENPPAPGSVVTGAGFGLVNATFRATQLQEADLEMLDTSVCEETYRREQFEAQLRVRYPQLLQDQGILCASYPERSACQGDSGGPLYQERNNRRFLVGIVSSGVSCRGNGISILPGLYISVADQIDFIDSVVYSPLLL